MNHAQRTASIEYHFGEIMKLSNTKGKEYANSETDANSNFKKIGVELNIDPKQILWVYKQKHNHAIAHFLKTGKIESTEPIKGRIYDEILYDFLLLTLLDEEENEAMPF